ncbi:MAG: hypothetical protein WBE80_04725 [Methylocella sp.]
MTEYEHVTTNAAVETYESSSGIFGSLLTEVKEFSKKKPEATMSAGKVKIINRVLEDLLTFLKEEPAGKYLDRLDDETLPQMSDAVLVMVQFESALESFKERYYKYMDEFREHVWITKENLAEWNEDEGQGSEGGEDVG